MLYQFIKIIFFLAYNRNLFSQFWSQKSKIKVLAGPHFLQWLYRDVLPCPSPGSNGSWHFLECGSIIPMNASVFTLPPSSCAAVSKCSPSFSYKDTSYWG